MATITALGAWQVKAAGTYCVSTVGVTLAEGDHLIVVSAADGALSTGQVWWYSATSPPGGFALTKEASALNSGNVEVAIWSYRCSALNAGIRSVYIGIGDGHVARTMTAYRVTGLINGAFDKSSAGTGSSGSPSSGATGTLAQADEVVIGGIGVEDNVEDIAGSWTTGSSNVSGNEQQTGTTGGGGTSNIVVRSAAEIVSATTAQTAAITSMASADWAAVVATFKAAAGATARLRSLLGVGL